MEVNFNKKEISIYNEAFRQNQKVQESCDAVVPDKKPDISKIFSVKTSVLLKSKDMTGRGASVTGEASACIIYIAEGEEKLEYLTVTRAFGINYEMNDPDPDALLQTALSISNCEVRVLNPRKLAVTFEISGELCCYTVQKLEQERTACDCGCHIHTRSEELEVNAVSAVCEKTFALTEQFAVPAGIGMPSEIICGQCAFSVGNIETVGSKVIVKGEARFGIWYNAEGCEYPLFSEYTSPFSQIIETREDRDYNCIAHIELTSIYCDIADTINSDKVFDTEVHAVVQLLCKCRHPVKYVADAYCNSMEMSIERRSAVYTSESELLKMTVEDSVSFDISDDCAEVIYINTFVNRCIVASDELCAALTAEILYRTRDGLLACVKRLINLNTENSNSNISVIATEISADTLLANGGRVDGKIAVDVFYTVKNSLSFTYIDTLTADEESKKDFASFPALSLVKAGGMSRWELAKKYHSTVETIDTYNPGHEDAGEMLLIPKCM